MQHVSSPAFYNIPITISVTLYPFRSFSYCLYTISTYQNLRIKYIQISCLPFRFLTVINLQKFKINVDHVNLINLRKLAKFIGSAALNKIYEICHLKSKSTMNLSYIRVICYFACLKTRSACASSWTICIPFILNVEVLHAVTIAPYVKCVQFWLFIFYILQSFDCSHARDWIRNHESKKHSSYHTAKLCPCL